MSTEELRVYTLSATPAKSLEKQGQEVFLASWANCTPGQSETYILQDMDNILKNFNLECSLGSHTRKIVKISDMKWIQMGLKLRRTFLLTSLLYFSWVGKWDATLDTKYT